MKKSEFWGKLSNYSIVVCGIVLIANLYFRKYLEHIIIPILFIGGIALIVYVTSEIMQFILKRKS